tara:strand:- start:697 stop:966 length:270 start_codon:yes stop_codon:yes gene_type:complete
MIQKLIIKFIFKSIYKAIKRKHDLKKIDEYVNKPNELDKQMKQVQKNLNKALKYIEVLEKDVGTLKNDSHPPIKNLERRLKKLEKNKGA